MKENKIILLVIILIFCFIHEVEAQTNTKKETATVNETNPEIEQGKLLISQSDCMSCHKATAKLIGPSFHDIAAKYSATTENYTLLAQKIIEGGRGNWGPMAMSPHTNLLPADAEKMVAYILSLK